MAARHRMEAVKGASGLLADAYRQRDRVGVIAFRGTRAELLLPPTGSIEPAEARPARIANGRSHASGTRTCAHVRDCPCARRADPKLLVLVILLTDGRANVALPDTDQDPWSQSLTAVRQLAEVDVPAPVLDTDSGFIRLGRARSCAGPPVGIFAAGRPDRRFADTCDPRAPAIRVPAFEIGMTDR